MKRYFEFVDTKSSKSSKFWEVWIEGTTMFTRSGEVGANGQTTISEFLDANAAQKALNKAVAETEEKGYKKGGRESSEVDIDAPTSSVMQEPKDDGRWSSLQFFAIAKRTYTGSILYAGNPNTSVEVLHQLANDGDG